LNNSSTYRVLLAAGGTGGHVYPAIAIADALRDTGRDVEIRFVGTKNRMEWIAVPKAGYEIDEVWISGIHRRLTIRNLLFPVKLATSIAQSYKTIRRFRPDVVVCCGGYVSGPIGWVAAKMGIPLVLQEQNSFPGVTNRLLGKRARLIFTAFEAAADHFPDGKVILCGNPTRKTLLTKPGRQAYEFFGFTEAVPTILILGGSGGAQALNQAVARNIDRLHNEMGLQIIWQCGPKYLSEVRELINPESYERLRLYHFIDAMPYAYGSADLVVTRAGASICAELLITGKPGILVPSPHVAGDHQTKNARAMVKGGASVMLRDRHVQSALATQVKELLDNPVKLGSMREAALNMARPDAAGTIAQHILKLIDESKKDTDETR
jgi:UDP-N-acetylglucosamine--N-acetylmuramyl-(pentapeptide) pyrophosphoryl-undecaprenol N-acetylglucosamine transferase